MTDRDAIRRVFFQFLSDETGLPTAGVTDRTLLRDGLGLDSVDLVGVVMRLEGHFHVRVSQAELAKLVTVGELLDAVARKSNLAVAA